MVKIFMTLSEISFFVVISSCWLLLSCLRRKLGLGRLNRGRLSSVDNRKYTHAGSGLLVSWLKDEVAEEMLGIKHLYEDSLYKTLD